MKIHYGTDLIKALEFVFSKNKKYLNKDLKYLGIIFFILFIWYFILLIFGTFNLNNPKYTSKEYILYDYFAITFTDKYFLMFSGIIFLFVNYLISCLIYNKSYFVIQEQKILDKNIYFIAVWSIFINVIMILLISFLEYLVFTFIPLHFIYSTILQALIVFLQYIFMLFGPFIIIGYLISPLQLYPIIFLVDKDQKYFSGFIKPNKSMKGVLNKLFFTFTFLLFSYLLIALPFLPIIVIVEFVFISIKSLSLASNFFLLFPLIGLSLIFSVYSGLIIEYLSAFIGYFYSKIVVESFEE